MIPDVVVYCDGGCTSNPGSLATAAVACDTSGQVIVEGARHAGEGTNNVAEYRALEHAIQLAYLLDARKPLFVTDSKLVVQQVNGWWAMRGNPELKDAHARVTSALMDFEKWSVKHVPREKNRRADWLVTKLLGHQRALKNAPDVDPIDCDVAARPGWSGV